MKAVVFEGKEKITIKEDYPKPELGFDEVLIKVKRVGICGSDVGSYEMGGPYLPGNIMGHEFSGEIVEIGEHVKKVKIGSRVTVNPQIPCHECYYCKHDQENMCKLQNYSLGTTEDGAMRDYINVKADRIHILPKNVSYEIGATTEPLAIAIHAIQVAEFQIGQSAAVIGAGTIGLMVLQGLKAAGASKVLIIEPVESKQDIALTLGADKVFKPDAWNKLKRFTNKLGPDHVFDCVGLASTITTALKLIRKGGQVTLIGMHADKVEINNILLLTTNNLSIRGVYGYTQDTFRTALNLFEQNKVNVEPLITKRITLDDVPEMFKILANPPHDELKVIVEMA